MENFIEALSMIYQQSWHTREVPVYWRLSNVTPIYKSWKESSDLSGLQKVMGQIILSAIMGTWRTARPGPTCLANLLSFVEKMTHLENERKAVAVV